MGRGIAPIRRSTKYLSKCPLVFKPRVKIMTVNFNDNAEDAHHEGARDFVFWNLPQSNKEILNRLVKIVGKSEEVLQEEAIESQAKSNPANFCKRLGFDRHCICEMPGQVPCPSLVPVPRHWRGKWYNQGHRWDEE